MTDDQSRDPVVQQFREQISDNDLVLLDALNKRVGLVRQLHGYKRQKDYDVFDPTREDWMLAYVARANRGPVGDDAAREFFAMLVDLTKREAARLLDEERARTV